MLEGIAPSIACPMGGGPSLNTDIGGIGVRTSFYLQTLLLACLSARSGTLSEISGALYTLIATNLALVVTSLILGLKSTPEISFQDALVVFYLLHLSWTTIFFCLPACNRFAEDLKFLKLWSIVQSYMVFTFAFALLASAKSFGRSPGCNQNAALVIFRPFPMFNAGLIVCWVLVVGVVSIYTLILVKEYIPPPPKRLRQLWKRTTRKPVDLVTPDPGVYSLTGVPQGSAIETPEYPSKSGQQGRYRVHIAWDVMIELIVITILWAICVMNTELLIRWNRFEASDASTSEWQFGQVLPMFLITLPLVNVIGAFREFGIRPFPNSIQRRD
ncbi:hypothetical protein BDZ94DRAFT_1305793 [Collybia nuda]|uniref:Uncharacterized protein n=1 Tax=Collybia nuda TaxID=64659 RepID=A0A9P5YBI3_9AGAR|nr:hypothetical protein BDZ94DRAFT_1305793 [Collybia nuda]